MGLVLVSCALFVLGCATGAEGLSLAWSAEWSLVVDIRAPRTAGAWCVGALLGLAGAIAQGLFRNPLADPYLLGSASGAGLGVVLVLAGGAATGSMMLDLARLASQWTLVGAAFLGALAGVGLTLVLARGASRPLLLLLAGVAVGVLLTAVSDLVLLLAPQALRARQLFLMGHTGWLGWPAVVVLGATLVACLPLAMRHARALDALVLGEDAAASLGLPLARVRLLLVAVMAWSTGCAVSQAGLVPFVGLVAPHLVRRTAWSSHGPLLALSALAGGALLMLADILSRLVAAPQEWPVGLVTALAGGTYLLVHLRRRALT